MNSAMVELLRVLGPRLRGQAASDATAASEAASVAASVSASVAASEAEASSYNCNGRHRTPTSCATMVRREGYSKTWHAQHEQLSHPAETVLVGRRARSPGDTV